MSSTVELRQWFADGDLTRHAREFGITFVGDDDATGVKQECGLSPAPPLTPLGGGAVDRYGGVFTVNSGEDSLLRLFGGGDSDCSVSGGAVDYQCVSPECSVVLAPLPSHLLRSLCTEGRISAQEAARTCQHSPEVRGLLHELVSAVEERETLAPRRQDTSIDPCEGPRDVGRKTHHRKSETPRKAVRRRRERRSSSSGGKKKRKRSTSCSTSSSTASTSSRPHRHHRKHRHRRKSRATPDPPPNPRVNPIFVWVKQEDTRIVEVLCEDYDKRNRIRLTKTAQGWRAIPRTERLGHNLAAQTVPPSAASAGSGHCEARADSPSPPVDGSRDDTSLVCEFSDDSTQQTKEQHDAMSNKTNTLDELYETLLSPCGSRDDAMSDQVLSPPRDPQHGALSLSVAPSECNDNASLVPDTNDVLFPSERRDSVFTPIHVFQDNELSLPETQDGLLPLHAKDDESSQSEAIAHVLSLLESKDDDLTRQDVASPFKEHGHSFTPPCDVSPPADLGQEATQPPLDEEPISESLQSPLDTKDNVFSADVVFESTKAFSPKLELCDDALDDATGAELVPKPEQEDSVHDDLTLDGLLLPKTEVCEEDDNTAAPQDCDLEPTDLSIPKKHDAVPPLKTIKFSPTTPIMQPLTPPLTSKPLSLLEVTSSLPLARPAHQQKPVNKSMFLESLLSTPNKCHPLSIPSVSAVKEQQPLNLDTSQSAEEKKPLARPHEVTTEGPKPKCLKVEDITLKNLLSRQPEVTTKVRSKTSKMSDENKNNVKTRIVSESSSEKSKANKSRLLELLTSELGAGATSPLDTDPLTQLRKVLSDPDITVPDPLLVPRDRLQELVASPAREIPRLLALRPELRLPDALSYPTLLRDPDLLVVPHSHLQTLLQKPDKLCKEEQAACYSTLGAFLDWHRYQNHQQAAALAANEVLESQLKQQQQHHQGRNGADLTHGELDAATAAALNQMLWLPYLSQLEQAALACGNNQEFLTMLNAVFPPNYPVTSPVHGCSPGAVPAGFLAGMAPSAFPGHGGDYKSQLELQQTLALWQEAMMQSAVSAAANPAKSRHPESSKAQVNSRYQSLEKKLVSSAARTSPISPNFQAHHAQRSQTAGQQLASGYQYGQQRMPRPSNHAGLPHKPVKSETKTPLERTRPTVTCKSLLNLLSNPKRQQQQRQQHQYHHQQQEVMSLKRSLSTPSPQGQQHSHLLAALGKPAPQNVPLHPHGATRPIDLSGRRMSLDDKPTMASKLKVKQHLVDPTITPKLLKHEAAPNLVTSTDAKSKMNSQLQVTHPHLWHPLFGSQKSFNSRWQWTTVTVNGE